MIRIEILLNFFYSLRYGKAIKRHSLVFAIKLVKKQSGCMLPEQPYEFKTETKRTSENIDVSQEDAGKHH